MSFYNYTSFDYNISVHVYYILNTTGTSFIVHVYISYPYLFSIILNITCIILQEVGWTFFIKQMPVINSLDIRIKQGNISLVNLKSLQWLWVICMKKFFHNWNCRKIIGKLLLSTIFSKLLYSNLFIKLIYQLVYTYWPLNQSFTYINKFYRKYLENTNLFKSILSNVHHTTYL